MEYLSRFFGANETNCGEHPVITIIQRLHRTIANVEELKQHLVATNVSNNVSVHIIEHLKLQRQVSKYFKEMPPIFVAKSVYEHDGQIHLARSSENSDCFAVVCEK